MITPKPCPFCGEKEGIYASHLPGTDSGSIPDRWFVSCISCGCKTSMVPTKDYATQIWNTRAPNLSLNRWFEHQGTIISDMCTQAEQTDNLVEKLFTIIETLKHSPSYAEWTKAYDEAAGAKALWRETHPYPQDLDQFPFFGDDEGIEN